jgi:hypothetical protein
MTPTILSIKPKRCAERSESDSRPKGVNEFTPNRLYNTIHESIKNQWKKYPPSWFLVIQWTPAPKDFATAQAHAKHFRNKFLSAVYKCHLHQIPLPKGRLKMVWFHEKALDPHGNIIYHSNLHLQALPPTYNQSMIQLDWIITRSVAPDFRCLKNLSRKVNPGMVIREWNYEHHAFYNLKDYNKFKYLQDSDLVLDYQNSDLVFKKRTK